MAKLKRNELLRLARLGAAKRLEELQDEARAIHRLLGGRIPTGRRRGRPPGSGKRATNGRRRRGWTAAQRKEAADRMRAYWAKRRGDKKK